MRFRLRETGTPEHPRFDNPGHDYPQVIEYRRMGPDRMIASISGPEGENVDSFDYRRIRCTSDLTP